MEAIDLEPLRRQSLWLSRLTLILLSLTLAVVALAVGTSLGSPWALRMLVHWLPTFFYFYALWAIRSTFRRFALGGVLGESVARGCTRAGWALALGGGFSAVGAPNLLLLLERAGMIPAGRSAGILHFDVAYLAVGIVGLALVLMGRLLRWAGALQSDAAALRDELGGFF